jgi:ribosomal protein S18 acetylase RimI-like enzyme
MLRQFDGSHPSVPRGPPDLEIREASSADESGIVAIRRERHGGEARRHQRWVSQHLRRCSGTPDEHRFVVARSGGAVVGYAAAGRFLPPENSPGNCAPAGFYLRGVVVAVAARRRGIGGALTVDRLRWVGQRATEAFFCTTTDNEASIRLHSAFGFSELTRDFWFPRLNLTRGGILFVCRSLGHAAQPSSTSEC